MRISPGKIRHRAVFAVLVVLGSVATGCGGRSEASPTPPAVSRADAARTQTFLRGPGGWLVGLNDLAGSLAVTTPQTVCSSDAATVVAGVTNPSGQSAVDHVPDPILAELFVDEEADLDKTLTECAGGKLDSEDLVLIRTARDQVADRLREDGVRP